VMGSSLWPFLRSTFMDEETGSVPIWSNIKSRSCQVAIGDSHCPLFPRPCY
jgi:hypothetical protein